MKSIQIKKQLNFLKMNHQSICIQWIQKLFYETNLDINKVRQCLNIEDVSIKQLTSKQSVKNINDVIIEYLIVEERYYQYFGFQSMIQNQTPDKLYSKKSILLFGYQIVQEIVFNSSLTTNTILHKTQILKKCNIDIFMLVSIIKGLLRNKQIRKQKIKTFFVQLYQRNNFLFFGLNKLIEFHENLVQKVGLKCLSVLQKEQQLTKHSYVINFYIQNSDFFPSTLQFDNILLKISLTLRLQVKQQQILYQSLQKCLFSNNYHLITIAKNFRFVIQFFRCSFQQKSTSYYPQKIFIKMLNKYNSEDILKIVSFAQIGLTWNQQEISTTMANIFKLGLTSLTFMLINAFIMMWLKNSMMEELIRVCQIYLPKIYVFLKHQKLFDISFLFLQKLSLGPKVPSRMLMNKLLDKSIQFICKDCPLSKRQKFTQFMSLVQTKYSKIATLQDQNYIKLKDYLKQQIQLQIFKPLKDEVVQQKLKTIQWQNVKIPLFGNNKRSAINNDIQKKEGDYRGLNNIGNSCYMNSFLQSLYMTIEFRKAVLNVSTLQLQKKVLKKYNQSSQKLQQKANISLQIRQQMRPLAQLQRLFSLLYSSSRSSITPQQIKQISPLQFQNTYQQDTIEFGRCLLDLIEKSSFQNLFQGQQTNQITCQMCYKPRSIQEKFVDIMLNKIDHINSLTQMINKCLQNQQIQGLNCDNCQQNTQKSSKKHEITKSPNYLILTLKRFEYDIKLNKNIKQHYSIDLQDEYVYLQGQKYQIYGIIVHRGQSANSGHYFSFCRQWKPQNLYTTQIIQNQQKIINQSQQKSVNRNQQKSINKYQQKMIDQNSKGDILTNKNQKGLQKYQKQQYQNQSKQKMNQQDKVSKQKNKKWLCLNDSVVSYLQSFSSIKQFLQLNLQDTPYIIFLQKCSHVQNNPQIFNQPIKLRQPLKKFIQKDNLEHKNNKKDKQTTNKGIDWKKFGKTKGFTAYDFLKFNKDDQDDRGNSGFGFNNRPIL